MKYGHSIVLVVALVLTLSCTAPSPSSAPATPPAPIPETAPTSAPVKAPVPSLIPKRQPIPMPSGLLPSGELPLVDAHGHAGPTAGKLGTIIGSLAKQAGVTNIILTWAPAGEEFGPEGLTLGEEEKVVLEAYEENPQLVIPFLTCIRWGVTQKKPAWLQYADKQLATGKFYGLGQFIVYRYRSHNIREADWNKAYGASWDSTWAQGLLRLAAKYNVPILFTMETTSETLLALDNALTNYPTVKLIWAHQMHLKEHLGVTPELLELQKPQHIATLLEKHSNLYIDLTMGRDESFCTQADRTIPGNWKDLYEKHNDRIVMGCDRITDDNYESKYLYEAGWIRSWLSELSTDTARKLAYENIVRILSQ